MKRIIVICEDNGVCFPAASYALAVARRMGARLGLLVLVTRRDAEMRDASFQVRVAGEARPVEVELNLRRGDPRSELYKFLASCPSYHAVVWAGDPEELSLPGGRTSTHWITSVLKDIHCPVLVPGKRQPRRPRARRAGDGERE